MKANSPEAYMLLAAAAMLDDALDEDTSPDGSYLKFCGKRMLDALANASLVDFSSMDKEDSPVWGLIKDFKNDYRHQMMDDEVGGRIEN